MNTCPKIIVAGHICIDMILQLPSLGGRFHIDPGSLMNIGPARFSAGGAVGNVGLALHQLGIPTVLMGKIGDDSFGQVLHALVHRFDPALTEAIIISDTEPTSYSIVIEPSGIDRAFLHCSGANDTLVADDFNLDRWSTAEVFHFGYPPIMPAMYARDGEELVKLFERVKSYGVITSLDMCHIDSGSSASRVDWRKLFEGVLPFVDLFVPSYGELAHMIGEGCPDETAGIGEVAQALGALAGKALSFGAGAVAIKLGEKGLYLHVGEGGLLPKAWVGRELWCPCYQVQVAGTTGAGDCTVAGLLTAALHGLSAEEALSLATGVGACSVEDASATGGVPSYTSVCERIKKGWAAHMFESIPPRWKRLTGEQLLAGPNDQGQ